MSAFLQILRFATVGLFATGVHSSVALLLIYTLNIPEQIANAFGFSAAFICSFIGHSTFTFKKRGSFFRFLLTAIFGFLINASTLYVLSIYGLPAYLSIPISTFIGPAVVFIFSKKWAFTGAERN
ncbi:GtrA family protein [Ochrobactrum soli]|uniref:GtrA family protein n=1 Tax=Ochrobactrum soli TaxID=2448455 RepID=UPI000D69F2C3|nr:GtrA family protein [[Ochrobactrum] soli]